MTRQILKSLGAAVLLAHLSACVTRPRVYPKPAPVHFTAAPEAVWAATLRVMTEENIPVASMDRASGFVRSDEIYLKETSRIGGHELGDIVDCGTEMSQDFVRLGETFLAFTVLVMPDPDGAGTLATVGTSIRNRNETTIFSGRERRCVSKGVFEPYMADLIRAALGEQNG